MKIKLGITEVTHVSNLKRNTDRQTGGREMQAKTIPLWPKWARPKNEHPKWWHLGYFQGKGIVTQSKVFFSFKNRKYIS